MSGSRWAMIGVVCTLAWACEHKLSAEEAIALGQQELKAGQREAAREHLEQGLAERDDEAAALVLAQLYLGEGSLDKVEPLLDKAIKAFPKSAALLALRAEVWAGQGQVSRAVSDYRKACEFAPENLDLLLRWAALNADDTVAISLERMLASKVSEQPAAEVLLVQGEVYELSGQTDRARAARTAAAEAPLGSADQAAALGRLMLLRTRPALDGAERLLRLAASAPKATVELLTLHAQVAMDLGRFSAAAESLDAATERWPEGRVEGPSLRLLRGRLALAQGNPKQAAEILEPLLGKLNPEQKGVLEGALGRALLHVADRKDEALKMLAGVPQGPGFAEAQVALAEAEMGGEVGPDAAMKRLNALIASNPRYETAYGMLATLQREAGKPELARKTLDRGIGMVPDSALLWYELGRTSLAEDPVRAAAELEKALRLSPTLLSARPLLAEAFVRSDRASKAVSTYEEGLRVAPDTLPWINNLAVLYADLGQNLDRAKTLAERAYEMGKKAPAVADTLGWVLLRAGEVQAATPLIEQAAAAMPEDGEVLMHLAVLQRKKGDHRQASAGFKQARAAAAKRPQLLSKIATFDKP